LLRDHLLDIPLDEQQPSKETASSPPENHADSATQQLLPKYSFDAAARQGDEEMEMDSYPKSGK
jgi:hypothetical protein